MRRDKRGAKSKSGKRRRPPPTDPPAAPPTAPTAPPNPPADPARPTRASGQRLYDMPYSAVAPRLVNPELGLHNLVARAGHNAGYDIDLTLLDASDHRLIRSGVLLAHRVLDGRGEWYLAAPDWVPLLPKELIEQMGAGELPDALADLIRPFRRRAPLGPVAALRCERREFALRDDQGTTVALLRDDKVTVRRGGLTTARYREVMLTPVGPGLHPPQAEWLDECLTSSGATPVAKFPRLVRRLGAPATGLTDFPEPHPFDPEVSFGQFVSQLVARRLREILVLDLRLRRGDAAAPRLTEQLDRTAVELGALAPVLDAEWTGDLVDELRWVGETIGAEAGRPEAGIERLASRLRTERYLTLLDRLVSAARSPRVTASGEATARQVLTGLSDQVLRRIRRACDRLSVDAPRRLWTDAEDAAARYAPVAQVVALVLPEETPGSAERIVACGRMLTEVRCHDERAEAVLDQIEAMAPADAFEAGRRFEREHEQGDVLRAAVVTYWAKTRRKLDR